MSTILDFFNFSLIQWLMLLCTALIVGFSKTGISGLLMLATSAMASVFGGKETTGIILPMLIVGDVFAVVFYKQHTDWSSIKKLLPWTFAGFVAGALTGNLINDRQFKILIALSVIVCLCLLIYTEFKGEIVNVPKASWFYILTGMAAGFTTMIGNAAGPIFSVYLLAMGFDKKSFMGTSAVFFMIVNISKVPLQVLFWNNITIKSVTVALIMIPLITVGALIGVAVNKKINEKPFRYLIIILTAVAAIRLLFV